MLFFTAANEFQILVQSALATERRVSIRGLTPDDANGHDESD